MKNNSAASSLRRGARRKKEKTDEIENRIHAAFDDLLEGVQIIDRGWRYVYVNEAAARHGHTTRAVLMGNTMMEMYPGIENTEMFAALSDCMDNRAARRMESEFTYPDGSRGWFSLSIQPVPEGILILSIDITAFKRSAVELQESEERYRLIAENAEDIIWTMDMQLRVNYASPSLERALGYTAAEIMTSPLERFLTPQSLASGIDAFNEEAGKARPQPDPDYARMLELEYSRKDGSTFRVEMKFSFFRDAAGKPTGVLGVGRDVTARSHAERYLRASERRFRSIFEQSPIGMGLIDTQSGRFLQVNSRYCEITGRTGAEMLTLDFNAITHPDDLGIDREQLQSLLRGDIRSYDFEKRYIRPDGSVIWAHVTVVALWEKQEEPRIHLSMVEDVTERKQAEEARRESQAQLASVIDSAMDAIISMDAEQRIVLFNPAAERMFRCPAAEVLGGPLDRIIPERFREAHRKHVRTYGETNQTNRSMGGPSPLSCLRADGGEFPAEITISQVETAGGKLYTAILRDVTESRRMLEALRHAEEKYRGIFENAVEAITQTTPDGRYITANPAAARMLGYETPEDLIAADLDAGFYVEQNRRTEFMMLMEENESISDFDSEVYCRDGSRIWISENSRAIRDEKGGLLYYEGTATEITERKRAEQALKRRAEELDALQSTVLELTAPHELPKLLHDIVARAVQLLNADGGGLYLCDQERQEARCVVSYKTPSDYTGVILKYGEGAAGLVAQTGEPLIVNDYRAWSGRAVVYEEEKPFERLASAPMKWQGTVTGVIHVLRSVDASPFAPPDMELLSLLANHAAIAVANAQQMEDLQVELTERRQAEEALRASEERLQFFFDQSLDGFFFSMLDEPKEWNDSADKEAVIDYVLTHQRVTEVNDAMIEQYGATRENFVGRTAGDFFAHDLDQARRFRRALFDAGRLHLETEERKDDGTPIWIEGDYVCIHDERGRIAGMFGIQRDITERRQAEEALLTSEKTFRGLFNSVAEAIYIQDADGRFLDVNEGALNMYGRTREFFVGNTPEPLSAPGRNDLIEIGRVVQAAFKGQPQQFEFWGIRSNGEVFPKDVRLYKGTYFGKDVVIALAQDITERKNAEENLRLAETRYRTLVEQLPLVVYVNPANDATSTVYVSPQIQSFLGCTREEWLADPQSWSKALHPGDRSRVMAEVERMTQDGEYFAADYRMIARDGSVIWIRDQAALMRDSKNEPQLWQGFMLDITERKHAEEALREAESKYRNLVERLPVVVYTSELGVNGRWFYVSPQIESLLGFTPEEWMADPGLWYAQVHPEDRDRQETLEEKAWARNEPYDAEYRILTRDGSVIWIRDTALIFPPQGDGAPIVQGTLIDITEQKRAEDAAHASEEKYRGIFENAVEGIYQSTPDGRFQTVNPACASMFGYDSPQEMIASVGDIASQVYHDPSRRADFMRMMEEQGGISGFEYQMRRKDGGLIWIAENARVVRDDGGRTLYYEGMLEDITARKENEKRIRAQLDQLNSLHVIENAINSNADLRTTLDVILREVATQLKVDSASVLLYNKASHTLDFTAGRGFHSKAVQHTKLGVGQGYAGRALLDRKIVHIPDLSKTDNSQLLAALNLAGENFAAYVGSPLIAKGQVVGVLEIFQRSPLSPDPDWFDFLALIADQAALAIDNARLFENLQRSNFELTLAYDATIEGWSLALDLRDRETEGHTRRVTDLTIKLARQMGISDADILHIRRGALLHDIGKMGIPDSILHKPAALTPAEWEIMHQHTKYARQMLTPISYLKPALDIPLFHHEKWDGSGYPEGLKGEQIPLAARIFAVVDVWDALTSNRSYRDAWSQAEALEYIRAESGKHFDPQVVENFLSLITQ